MKKLVVFTGAGISKESGISTFRDNDGLWEKYKVEDVATPAAWRKDKEFVLDFYNQRRKQLKKVQPNNAHIKLAQLEEFFDVQIITQNVDDLHERAGSTNVTHLHGELLKSRSSLTSQSNLIYDCEGDIKIGDKCEYGSQLRPHVVWFGEDVPMMHKAFELVKEADLFLIIGTSLQVYPAADLAYSCPERIAKYIIDVNIPENTIFNLTKIEKSATEGIEDFINLLNI
jgi:NAD-dependent deacetylase